MTTKKSIEYLKSDTARYSKEVNTAKISQRVDKMPVLLEKEDRRCGKCNFVTPHVYVKNMDVTYWRCEVCVEKTVSSGKIFIPKYVEKRPFWKGFNDLGYTDQMAKFKKRTS